MLIKKSRELLSLQPSESITKRNLYDLIQYSKVKDSEFWGGPDAIIGNTPQQGINWIGSPPDTIAVIIKTRPGSYEHDGWVNDQRDAYQYSFKARNGSISYTEKANEVLVKQPQQLYPILLFTESKQYWLYEGSFDVAEIKESFVILSRRSSIQKLVAAEPDECLYQEGGKRYVTHLLAERSSGVVAEIKVSKSWSCEICAINFQSKYGYPYIEAHHKTPISSYSSNYTVTASDLALLCPNCHKAVHIHMKQSNLSYEEIKSKLLRNG